MQNGAPVLARREKPAGIAATDLRLDRFQRAGHLVQHIRLLLQQPKRHALRAARTDAGKALELLNQALNGGLGNPVSLGKSEIRNSKLET